MLVVTALTILGLLGGIVGAQLRGYRLGGVLIVPLFAIYTLRTFGTFPVLVMSVIGGYVSLWIVRRRLLLYGRSLFVVAVGTSALVPLVVFGFTRLGFGPTGVVGELGFIGSVLPGIAAYNFHRLPEEKRVLDAVWGLALLLLLITVGIGLVIFVGLTPLRDVMPPVLLGPDADIALGFGLELSSASHPTILPFPEELAMLGLGLAISEGVRVRWGIRIFGLIVVPLLVLLALRAEAFLVLYLLAAVVSYAGIRLLHWWTLLYGRVLLSMGVILGVMTVISVVPAFTLSHGLLPFFSGVLGGVSAYNIHAVPPSERWTSVVLSAGVFVALAAIARLFLTPLEGGILLPVGIGHVVSGVFILAIALREAVQLETMRPANFDRMSSIWQFDDAVAEEHRS